MADGAGAARDPAVILVEMMNEDGRVDDSGDVDFEKADKMSSEDTTALLRELLPNVPLENCNAQNGRKIFGNLRQKLSAVIFDAEDPKTKFALGIIFCRFYCSVCSNDIYEMKYEDAANPNKRTSAVPVKSSEFKKMFESIKVTSASQSKPKPLAKWFAEDSDLFLTRTTASKTEPDSATNLHIPSPPKFVPVLVHDGTTKPGDFPADFITESDAETFDTQSLFREIDEQALANEANGKHPTDGMSDVPAVFCLWYLMSGRNELIFCLLLKWHACELQFLTEKFELTRIFVSDPGAGKSLLFEEFIGKGVWQHLYTPIGDIHRLVDPKDNAGQHGKKSKLVREYQGERLPSSKQSAIKTRVTDRATFHRAQHQNSIYGGVEDLSAYTMLTNMLSFLRNLPLDKNRSYTGELKGLNEEFFNHIAPICKGFGARGLRTEEEKDAAAARKDAAVQQHMYVMMQIPCDEHNPTTEVELVNGANPDVVPVVEGGALAEKSQKLHYLVKHMVAVYYYRGRSEDFRSRNGLLWLQGRKGLHELLVQQVKTHARKAPNFWMVVSDNNYKQMDDETDKKRRNTALMRQLQELLGKELKDLLVKRTSSAIYQLTDVDTLRREILPKAIDDPQLLAHLLSTPPFGEHFEGDYDSEDEELTEDTAEHVKWPEQKQLLFQKAKDLAREKDGYTLSADDDTTVSFDVEYTGCNDEQVTVQVKVQVYDPDSEAETGQEHVQGVCVESGHYLRHKSVLKSAMHFKCVVTKGTETGEAGMSLAWCGRGAGGNMREVAPLVSHVRDPLLRVHRVASTGFGAGVILAEFVGEVVTRCGKALKLKTQDPTKFDSPQWEQLFQHVRQVQQRDANPASNTGPSSKGDLFLFSKHPVVFQDRQFVLTDQGDGSWLYEETNSGGGGSSGSSGGGDSGGGGGSSSGSGSGNGSDVLMHFYLDREFGTFDKDEFVSEIRILVQSMDVNYITMHGRTSGTNNSQEWSYNALALNAASEPKVRVQVDKDFYMQLTGIALNSSGEMDENLETVSFATKKKIFKVLRKQQRAITNDQITVEWVEKGSVILALKLPDFAAMLLVVRATASSVVQPVIPGLLRMTLMQEGCGRGLDHKYGRTLSPHIVGLGPEWGRYWEPQPYWYEYLSPAMTNEQQEQFHVVVWQESGVLGERKREDDRKRREREATPTKGKGKGKRGKGKSRRREREATPTKGKGKGKRGKGKSRRREREATPTKGKGKGKRTSDGTIIDDVHGNRHSKKTKAGTD